MSETNPDRPVLVNVAQVKHLSPFRYPGGKTWLVPRVNEWLRSLDPLPVELAEPFAGGAIIALSALFAELVKRVVLVEKDFDVASVWKVMLNAEGVELAKRIVGFDLTLESAKALLATEPKSDLERAFATIVRNRVQRGGILAPGASLLKKGETNKSGSKGVLSRWYPETLQKRINAIIEKREKITFIQGDGIDYIRYNAFRSDAAFFIDPPYTVAGRRLYSFSEIDHRKLFKTCTAIKGAFLMTYNDTDEIRKLAGEFGFQTTLVAMKNTHHEVMHELLIGKNLEAITKTPQPLPQPS